MSKCDICHSGPRMRVSYGRNMLCSECFFEYRAIFEGVPCESELDTSDNPLFQSFKYGWETEERERLLSPLPIPEAVRKYYNELLLKIKDEDEDGEE